MKIKLFFLVCLGIVSLKAEIGCMDNSYHGDTNYGYDYKAYHYVECYCPCQKYVQDMDRGYCLKCGHYRGLPGY